MTDQEILRDWVLNVFNREAKENPELWENRGGDIFASGDRVFTVKDNKISVFCVKNLTFGEFLAEYYTNSLV